jgi:hypothetical protein
MLYGVFLSFSNLKKQSYPGQAANLLIIYLFIVIYASIHLLTWTLIRYRIPIDAVLILFAAVGIENLVNRSRLLFK